MSKLKKALDKAQESRGRGYQEGVRGAIKPPTLARVTLDEAANLKAKLDIRYSETKVQKIENSVLKKGKIVSHFHETEKIDQIKTLRTQILDSLHKLKGNSLLVTSANHLPRAVGLFCKHGWPVIPYPVDHSSSMDFELEPEFALAIHAYELNRILYEWIGLTAYYLSGKTDQWLPGGCAAPLAQSEAAQSN